jgi:hypothetical protein
MFEVWPLKKGFRFNWVSVSMEIPALFWALKRGEILRGIEGFQ